MSNLHFTIPLLAPVFIALFLDLRWSARAKREAAMDSGDSPDRAGVADARPVNPFDAIEWRWPS